MKSNLSSVKFERSASHRLGMNVVGKPERIMVAFELHNLDPVVHARL